MNTPNPAPPGRDAYTRLASAVLFPLHERLKGHATLAVRQRLERSQWWSVADLESFRVKRLRRLLAVAQSRVPYYRDLFAAIRFEPNSVAAISDLARLPFLTKPLIRTNVERLKARGAHVARFNTGGSSGEPLVFFIGKERVSHDVAAKWRATRWWGVDIGDPEIVIWGSPIELSSQDRLRVLRDRLMRSWLLPAFDMSDARIDAFISILRRVRPRMLFGYPSALSRIALRALANGTRLDDLGVRVAFVTSERLYDDQRTIIATTFGCHVANGYGGRDAGFVAHECPAGSMHITAEDIVVEIVDTNGMSVPAGNPGEIVVTHLATSEFPFIRYRTGDVGVLTGEPCTCGRGLPVLKEVQGRSTDFVVAQNGSVMHGLALIYVLRDLAGIEAFKIVQESIDRTRILIVKGAAYTEATEEKIRAGIKARLGDGVELAIEPVGAIPAEKSGKFRYVESRV